LYYIQQIDYPYPEVGIRELVNYIGGEWVEPQGRELFNVINPATGELLGRTPVCGNADVYTAAWVIS